MNLSRGVQALKISTHLGTDNLIHDAIDYAVKRNYAQKGDKVVCLLGQNVETPENINLLKIKTI